MHLSRFVNQKNSRTSKKKRPIKPGRQTQKNSIVQSNAKNGNDLMHPSTHKSIQKTKQNGRRDKNRLRVSIEINNKEFKNSRSEVKPKSKSNSKSEAPTPVKKGAENQQASEVEDVVLDEVDKQKIARLNERLKLAKKSCMHNKERLSRIKNKTFKKLKDNVLARKRYNATLKALHSAAFRTSKGQEKVLQKVCKNSNLCLALTPQYSKLLSNYFKNYLNFEYLDRGIVISSGSANGTTSLLKFKRGNYESDIVMKFIPSKDKYLEVDNLFYEMFVGQEFVNKFHQIYPVFVETYGGGKANPNLSDTFIRLTRSKKPSNITNLLKDTNANSNPFIDVKYDSSKSNKFDISEFVKEMKSDLNKQLIFVQTIENAISMNDLVYDALEYSSILSTYNMLTSLYQVYFALVNLKDEFTHYDLHKDNVLIYNLPKTKAEGDIVTKNTLVKMNYPSHSFYSTCVPKIIDYGRCYTPRTNELIVEMCTQNKIKHSNLTNKVDKHIFDEFLSLHGLTWASEDKLDKDSYYINSRMRNMSHDLRLLNELYIDSTWKQHSFKNVLQKLCFMLKRSHNLSSDFNGLLQNMMFLIKNTEIIYEQRFGTNELDTAIDFDLIFEQDPSTGLYQKKNGIGSLKYDIRNVDDAFRFISALFDIKVNGKTMSSIFEENLFDPSLYNIYTDVNVYGGNKYMKHTFH